jgi:xanthine dehydrogenase accessory factor
LSGKDHFTNPHGSADVLEELARCRREREGAVLATVVEVTGSAPQIPGAKLLVRADGAAFGTIGGGAVEREVLRRAAALFEAGAEPTLLWRVNLTRELGMCCGGEMSVFFERVRARERLVLFGAGHVGRELAEVAARAGFEVTVVDERPEWATRERFPLVHAVLAEEPEVALPEILLDGETYCVVVTHDHPLDQRLVKALLGRPLRFLGLVASRAKRNKFVMRLAAQGVPESELARLRSPVGIEIGAVTPHEIAVSIVAELIAVRRGVSLERAGAAGGRAIARRHGERA